MTRVEHLLTIVAEECCEVAHRASKALRFGLDEVQPGQDLTNAQRVAYEYADLVAVMIMLSRHCPDVKPDLDNGALEAKRLKVEKFIAHSEDVGTLVEPAPARGSDEQKSRV
jgi:NTP pyrophosphatase (non-canonical NTP hydrolase)